MFKLIEKNKVGFSSKGHISKKELAKCFIDAVTGLATAAGGSLLMFQEAVLNQAWLFLGLWGIIFIAIFVYKVIDKISKDGNQMNYDIHKEVIDQSDIGSTSDQE